jgi:molybdenum cofactor biosynthesis enzyme MoaA
VVDPSKLKNFCAIPFHHVQIRTNGDFNVCCNHGIQQEMNINTHTVEQWRGSKHLAEVQQAFLNDEKHPGCQRCWRLEDQGYTSLRQRVAGEYQILKVDVEQKQLTNVEVDLTNLCNLKCLMCNEHESSSILAENTQLGINRISQKDVKWTDTAYENLKSVLMSGPKIVNIRGGEPLYIKQLLELVENVPEQRAKTIALHITTNATVWNDRWARALSKFKLVRFMFSVDAVEELYEYMRFPGKWSVVASNIDTILQLPNAKCLVHCVVQNLNVASLGSLIAWCADRSLWLNLSVLENPQHLILTNLPDAHRSKAILHLKNVLARNHNPNLTQTLQNLSSSLERSKFDSASWNQFTNNITMRDRLRGNDYKKFIESDLAM